MFEFSGQCNQRCRFCYNSWKAPESGPKRELGTNRVKELLAKTIDASGCESISLSGGEPVLRADLFEIIAFIKGRGPKVSLVTNGTLLDDAAIDRALSAGVDLFQVSLLGDTRELHNRLAGFDAFDRVIEAILNVRGRGGRVSTFFVGLADNIDRFAKTLELNVLLGVENVALGRFTPGGSGIADWERLMPSPEALDGALAAADEMSGKYRLSVSLATPVLPCLHDLSRYRRLRFSFCSVGAREHGLFGIDPEGNLKACSHSPRVLGNLLEEPFERLIRSPFLDEFTATVPAFCRSCPDLPVCRGGCRSSAKVCSGSFAEEDPYLAMWKSKAVRPTIASFVSSTGVSA